MHPRVAVCVPSGITGVESRAVIDAAVMAGARKVFLIEEPIAAAIGAGIDITKPSGTMIVDVGGGTADIGVISLSGIVVKTSIKMAGNKFDQTIIRYVKNAHNILIGEKTAQIVKETVGCAFPRDDDTTIEVKGRSLLNGLPQKITLTWQEIYECLKEPVNEVVDGVKLVLEKTPPELVGDIAEKGIVLTGGGSLLWGFDKCIAHHTKIGAWVAENARECVAIGTGKSFQYIGEFFEGFVDASAQF